MTDTVKRIMEMIDEHAHNASEATRLDYETWHLKSKVKQAFADVQTSRQALHDELVRLFTPLSDEQIQEAATLAVKRKELNWAGFSEDGYGVYTIPVLSVSHMKLIRIAEKAHGIGGES